MKLATGVLRTAFTLSMFLFCAWMLVDSISLSRTAALIPMAVISGSLGLLALQFLLDLIASRKEAAFNGTDQDPHDPDQAIGAQPDRRILFFRAVLWVSLLAFVVWGLGLVAGSALFSLAFLRGHTRESWAYCIVYALVLALTLSLVFFVLLNVPPYAGAVFHCQ